MAQFIQSNQLSPISGSAGQQSVVTDNGPTFGEGLQSAVQNVGNLVDTAGNIYGQNKAQSLVTEEIENIDRARKAAESGKFTAGDPVPESLNLDQQQWDMLANAVGSGTMSREKARLLASSRLRTRIAEEPFFADRMRKAASGVLGFNIQSEGAQQYFASFPTQASISSSGGNDILDKYRQQAEAWVATGVTESVEAGMQYLAKLDRAEADNKIAEAQAAAGIRSANDMAGSLISNHNSVAWGKFLGDLKATEVETGQPVKPEEFTRTLSTQKQLFKERFDNSWMEAGGNLNSEDYNRHLTRINNEYQQMEDFVTEYGIDNIMKLKVDRQEQLFDLMGQQMFPQLTMITRTFGQQVTSDLINMAAMNPSKRDLLMSQNPELAAAFRLMDSDPKQFTQKLMGVAGKVLNGESLDQVDQALVDYTTSTLHKNGSANTKEGTLRGLIDQGLDYKGLSLIVDSRAYLEPQFSKDTFKTLYEQGMPAAVKQLATEITRQPGIIAEVDDTGNVVVSQDIAGGAMPQTAPGGLVVNPEQTQAQIVAFSRAKDLANKINLYTKGMGRGYDQVVGKSKEQHALDLRKMFNEDRTNASSNIVLDLENKFNTATANNDVEAAKAHFQELKRFDPTYAEMTWDDVVAQAMEVARQELEGGQ